MTLQLAMRPRRSASRDVAPARRIANKDTGDDAGDLFFTLISATKPTECAKARTTALSYRSNTPATRDGFALFFVPNKLHWAGAGLNGVPVRWR